MVFVFFKFLPVAQRIHLYQDSDDRAGWILEGKRIHSFQEYLNIQIHNYSFLQYQQNGKLIFIVSFNQLKLWYKSINKKILTTNLCWDTHQHQCKYFRYPIEHYFVREDGTPKGKSIRRIQKCLYIRDHMEMAFGGIHQHPNTFFHLDLGLPWIILKRNK